MSRLVFLCMMIGVATAATARGRPPKKPAHLAHKVGCFIEEIQDVIPYGTDATPLGNCMRIECDGDWLFYATCGVASTDDPKCHITGTDPTRPYPDCCPTIKCETENQI